jgi:hypothetical protein
VLYSQQNSLNNNCSGFTPDSAKGFINEFSLIKAIGNIKQSNALFELRYYTAPSRGHHYSLLYQIKLHTDGVSTAMVYRIDRYIKMPANGAIWLKDDQGEFYYRSKQFELVKNSGDTFFFDKEISSALFNLGDQKRLIDSLRNFREINSRCNLPGIVSKDCIDHFNLLEVKAGPCVRNFTISAQATEYYTLNSRQAEFKAYADLILLIRRITGSVSIN